MRIVHVSDSYLPKLGGMEIQVAELASRQRAAGHHVQVVTASRRGPEESLAVPVHRLVDGRAAHPLARLAAPGTAARAVLTGDVDVVHAHVGVGSPVAFAAAAAAAGAGLPTVVTVHSVWAHVHTLFRAVDTVSGLSALPIRWTAVSEVAAAPVRRLLPYGTTVQLLPNGVDPAAWNAPPLPRTPGTVTVAAVMRLTTRKRILPLLRILRAARAGLPESVGLRAVVVGDGPRRPAAERYVDRHGLAGWAHLTGPADRSAIAHLHRSADVFIAPADLESFGIAALEARCAGLPVLAKAGSGVEEFVRHGWEGLLAVDDEELIEHLILLATDGELRARLRRHNLSTPCPISWASVLERVEDIYADAAAPASPAVDRPLPARWLAPA